MLHRDDVDLELIKLIENEARRQTGNDKLRVVFPGDLPESELPPDLRDTIEQVEKMHQKSVETGCCVQCGMVMPGYPTKPEDITDDWAPADKWGYFIDIQTGDITAWSCPSCHGGRQGLSSMLIPLPKPGDCDCDM